MAWTTEPWTPIFKGVHHAVGDSEGVPRPQKVNAIRIDLLDPDIQFITTPSNGAAAGDTNRQTGSQYMAATGVQIGVNGQFYITNEGINWNADLEGLALHQGQIVSPAENLNAKLGVSPGTLWITQANAAHFQVTLPSTDLTGCRTALESWPYFLKSGANSGDQNSPAEPRTAVGLTQNGRYLIILTIDGRQTGYSEGATYWETAQWLTRFGAYHGLNLDGGGSTHLWISEYGGSTYALNSPSENRAVGNHLGVYVAPLPPIVYADVTVFADFEDGDPGPFDQPNFTYPGSGSYGIAGGASTVTLVTNESYRGGASQRLYIHDNPMQSGGWFVRHLAGLGQRINNTLCMASGFVGLWAKTVTPGCEISIAIDNSDAAAVGRGVFRPMVADGAWRLYEWNLEDDADWESWDGGSGMVDTVDFTLDSIQVRNASDVNAAIFIDDVAHHGWLSLAYLFAVPGDFQPDGRVDFEDFALMARQWLMTSSDMAFDPLYDLSDPQDGWINISDLWVFIENWLVEID
jgi:hypothetical protein